MTDGGTPKGEDRPMNPPMLKQTGYTLEDWNS